MATDPAWGRSDWTSTSKQHGQPGAHYESIRLTAAGDRACLYNDGDKTGCASITELGKGDCTIGWGHKLHDGPCGVDDDKYNDKQYADGITLKEADRWLDNDIKTNALDPLNDCVTAPLSAGELKALISFLFNNGPGPVQAVRKHWITDKKTGQRKLVPCVPGPVAKLLNQGHYEQLPEKLRQYINSKGPDGKLVRNPGLVKRREWEIYDATGGREGKPRPAKWYVTAGIRSVRHGVGTVTVGGKVCATNEKGVRPRRCGPFSVDQAVTVAATTHDPNSRFVRWEGGVAARDLCVGQGNPCTIRVQDSLVRVVAVFERGPPPDCSADDPASPPPPGCVRVTVRVIPAPLPSDPSNESIGEGVGSATLEPGGTPIPCLNPADAPCVRTADVPANTTASVSAQPGSLSEDPSSPPDSALWKFAGACTGTGACTFTSTNGATVDVYFIPAMVTLTLEASGDEGHANMTANEYKGGGLEPVPPVYCGFTYPANALPCKVMVRVEKFAQVEADAAGDPSIALDGFSNNCTPEAPESSFCELRMTSNQTVTAMFATTGIG